MTTLIVCGMQTEANLIGTMPSVSVIIGAGNAGKLAADIEAAIEAGGVERVLSFGTAGGLGPALQAGQLIVGVPDALPYDYEWSTDILDALDNSLGTLRLRVADGVFTLATETIADPAAKAALRASTGADAVDLESIIAARAASAHGLPFAILRAITDTADFTLPPAATVALNASGGIDIFAVLESLGSDVGQFPELVTLGENSTLAFNNLSAALGILGDGLGA